MHKTIIAAVALLAMVGPAAAANLVTNGTFVHGVDPWWLSGKIKLSVGASGALCIGIPGGTVEIWDQIVGQNDISLKQNAKYKLTFDAQANPPGNLRALVQMPAPPWTPYASLDIKPDTDGKTFSVDFTSPITRKDAQIAFQFGGAKKDWVLCLDNISIEQAG